MTFETCEPCAQPESCTNNGRCFGESARGMQFGKVPGGTRDELKGICAKHNPWWEAGVQGEKRPDGSFMPYIDEDRQIVRNKKWHENERGYKDQIRRLKSDPEVFSKTKT